MGHEKATLGDVEVKALDGAERVLRFIGSTPARDRVGDEIDKRGSR